MSKNQFVYVKPNSIEPCSRSGHRCVTDDINLYVFGGFNPNTTEKLFSEIWCFNLSLKTWSKIETTGPSPPCVASSTVVLKRQHVIVFGGSGYPFGSTNCNKTFICDLRARQWREMNNGTSIESPSASYGQSAVISPDNFIYVFGGTKGLEYNNDLHKINLDTHSWERVHVRCDKTPSARYRHEAVSIDDGFVVMGGYGQNGACSLDKVSVFNYEHGIWATVNCRAINESEFPGPRRAHSCVKFNDGVYVCGGYSEINTETNEHVAYNDLWKLDLETFTWCKIDQVLPFPRFFHSAAVTSEGCMYIYGGVQQISNTVLARTSVMFKMWLVVPALLELCWEKVCKVHPISTSSFKTLANLGVPRHLLARCVTTS